MKKCDFYLSKCNKFVASIKHTKNENNKVYIINILTFPKLDEVTSFSIIDKVIIKKFYWNKDSTKIYIISYSRNEEDIEKTFLLKFNLVTHELIYVKNFEKYLDNVILDPNLEKICWTDSKTKSFSLLNIQDDLLYNYDNHADYMKFTKPIFNEDGDKLLILSESYVHLFDVKDCLARGNRIMINGGLYNKVLNLVWTNDSQIIMLTTNSCQLYNSEGYLTKIINPYLVNDEPAHYLSISPCNEMVVFATKGMIWICNLNNSEKESKVLCRFTCYFNCARFEFMRIDYCMSNIFWSPNSKIIGFLCTTQRNRDFCKIVIYDIEGKSIIFFENYVSFFGSLLFISNNSIFFRGLDNNIHSLIHNKDLIHTIISFCYSTKEKPEEFKPTLPRDIFRKVCMYICDDNEEINEENINFQFSKNRNLFRIWF